MQRSMLELNSDNIDEYLYKLSGETHRGFFWRRTMRIKWWWQEFYNNHYLASNNKREFLLLDLQRLLIHPVYSNRNQALRYIDKDGILVEQDFKVICGWRYIELMEAEGSRPRPAKHIKGPKTYRVATHTNTKYSWWVIPRKRGWSLSITKTW